MDGKPDFAEIDPLFLTMPDNHYLTLGTKAGDAWIAGKNLIQKEQPVPGKDSK